MSADETKIDQQQVWREHLSELNVPAHWVYIVAVLGGGFLLMVALIAIIAGGSG